MLWAGVPLVARLGDTFAGRVSASVLDAAGLPELVARSDGEYLALADALAANAGQRRLLLIASTDLCHYPSDAAAVGLVKETMAYVEKTNVPALFTYLDETRRSRTADNVQTAMCGSGGVGTALIYAQARIPRLHRI